LKRKEGRSRNITTLTLSSRRFGSSACCGGRGEKGPGTPCPGLVEKRIGQKEGPDWHKVDVGEKRWTGIPLLTGPKGGEKGGMGNHPSARDRKEKGGLLKSEGFFDMIKEKGGFFSFRHMKRIINLASRSETEREKRGEVPNSWSGRTCGRVAEGPTPCRRGKGRKRISLTDRLQDRNRSPQKGGRDGVAFQRKSSDNSIRKIRSLQLRRWEKNCFS